MRDVVVLGAGLHRFGRFPEKSLPELGRVAIENALQDAGMPFRDIEVAYVGRVLAGMGAGLSVVSEMGRTGIPVINIEMACGSSTSAFREAYLSVANGVYETALVVGFEKMQRGLIQIAEQRSYQTVMGLAVMPAAYALQARHIWRITVRRRRCSWSVGEVAPQQRPEPCAQYQNPWRWRR
jgi:acetyl-CoA acetyltransferase